MKVFTDESCLNEKCLGLGGIFISEEHYIELESKLEEYALKNGFGGIEFSYKKCGKSDVDRYIGLASVFFDYVKGLRIKRNEIGVDFRALVINTSTNSLETEKSSAEEGFYKFYHFFITRSIYNITKLSNIQFELNVADKPDSYQYRTEIMNSTIGGCLKREFGGNCELKEIERGNPKSSRIHQMADILLGCATYRFNDKCNNKENLVQHVEACVGRHMFIDFKPWDRPFNVWAFSTTGQARWVPGATGVA